MTVVPPSRPSLRLTIVLDDLGADVAADLITYWDQPRRAAGVVARLIEARAPGTTYHVTIEAVRTERGAGP